MIDCLCKWNDKYEVCDRSMNATSANIETQSIQVKVDESGSLCISDAFFLLIKKGSRTDRQMDLNMILISSKKIFYNTSYVPNSNMATSAGVSVYCTSINKCQLSIYHYHYCSKCPSDIHLHVSWQEPKNITFGGFFKTGQKVKSKLPNIFISPQTLNHL